MIAVDRRDRTPVSAAPAVVAAVGGSALLLVRPWLVEPAADPTAVLVLAFLVIGVLGATVRIPAEACGARPGWRTAVVVTAVGVGAFVVGRLVGGGTAPAPALASYLVLNTLAAVAEEALFRRLLFGALLPLGTAVAVVGSATVFAAVHLTVWGAWALPLDLAAGLLLSWQRAASGRWSVPAVTHGAANVAAVL